VAADKSDTQYSHLLDEARGLLTDPYLAVRSTSAVRAKANVGHQALPNSALLIGCHSVECFSSTTADTQDLGCSLAE
jgi:hypothetical protein